MYKKFFVLVVAIALVTVGMGFGQGASDTVNFSLTLDMMKYIECVPGPISWFLGTTHYTTAWGPPRLEIYVSNEWDLAYANCPFQVTISGNNDNNDGIPRFARLEEGPNSNGYDTLPTIYNIRFLTNGSWWDFTDWFDGSSQFPITKDCLEAPHNGQVRMKMTIGANSTTTPDPGCPTRKIAIDPSFTWDQSADAGTYSCTLIVTFTAL